MAYYHKNNLKKYRESSGYTQQQVADFIGLDKSQVCRYENGEQEPKGDNIKRLARLFKVSVEELMGMPDTSKFEISEDGKPLLDIEDCQVVRRELFSRVGDKSAVITPDGVRFSSACVKRWEDITYIRLMVDGEKKLLVIRKSNDEYIDSQRWATEKEGRIQGRKGTGRPFADGIYSLMEWSCGY